MNINCIHTTFLYPWHSFEFKHEDRDGTTTKTHLLALSEFFLSGLFYNFLTREPIKFKISSEPEVYITSLHDLKNLLTEEAAFISFLYPEESQEWVERCLEEIGRGTPIDTLLEREIVLPFKPFESSCQPSEGVISTHKSFCLKSSPYLDSPSKPYSCGQTPETISYMNVSPIKLPPFLSVGLSTYLEEEERELESPKPSQRHLHAAIQGNETVEKCVHDLTDSERICMLPDSPISFEQKMQLLKPFFRTGNDYISSKENCYTFFKNKIFEERANLERMDHEFSLSPNKRTATCDQYDDPAIYEKLVETYVNRFTRMQGLDLYLTEDQDLNLQAGVHLHLPEGPLSLALGIDLLEQGISLPLQNELNRHTLAPIIPSLQIAALIIVIKMSDDFNILNKHFLSYLPPSSYSLKEINNMELAFLKGIDWKLSLSKATINSLRNGIREKENKEEKQRRDPATDSLHSKRKERTEIDKMKIGDKEECSEKAFFPSAQNCALQ
ncbi:hypothetical protein [Candidatus Protochlamydia phocaeensis]|uniref:hypothetical protein n=1 Tax=Candidatus Protochlamydia phocaeensis TaxID=1414722 RepID=UPI000838B397|nr:hypothetical protein [Candidatus Protochlamydia phocaeensis]